MRSLTTLLISVCCISFVYGQNKLQKLIVAEFMQGNGSFNYITYYNFKGGKYIGKDTLLQVGNRKDGYKTPTVSLSQAGGRIYNNQYYIPNYGSVLDLKKSKIIKTQDGDSFVRIQDNSDTLIFFRNNIYTGKGYLALDLTTEHYDFLKDQSSIVPTRARSNPSKTHFLELDRSALPYKIWLHDYQGNKKLIIKDVKSGPMNYSDAQFPDIETHWLNDDNFLYVVHTRLKDSSNQNLYHKVDIRKYNIKDDMDENFYTHDSLARGIINGRFYVDPTNKLLHKASSNDYYLVDTINKKMELTNVFNINQDFTYSSQTYSNDFDRTYYYHNRNIGSFWSILAKSTSSSIALLYGDYRTNLGYPRGIQIWTAEENKWLTFDIPWVNNILGWIEE